MSSFTEPLEVRFICNGQWETTRTFEYYHDHNDKRLTFLVPSGFKTDFASIPRAFWSLIGHPAGEYVQAAVLHDHLYRSKSVSRKHADDIFLEAMVVLGVSPIKRRLMYYAVRTFGKGAY